MSDIVRINSHDALELYRESSLIELGIRADEITRTLHPAPVRSYIIERNINYTNICSSRCSFCAFSVSPLSDKGYTLDIDQINAKIKPLMALGGRQILLQGGMNPQLPFDWYEQLLSELKSHWPTLHIHAFSPPEICFFSQHFDMPISHVIQRLHQAGLDSIPGGGAEILVDRVRQLISPGKCDADQWLEVMRQAHRLGLCTTATMMFGHAETIAERIEHLDRIRQLQDESLAQRTKTTDTGEKNSPVGFFTAFTCWPFQPGQTRLGKWPVYDPQSGKQPHPGQLQLAGAYEQLKMTALARIYLDNIENIQASWVTQGPKIGQLSLLMGCNDMGSLMMEENVVAAAGTAFTLKLRQLQDLIRTAGFQPIQRDYYYNQLDCTHESAPN